MICAGIEWNDPRAARTFPQLIRAAAATYGDAMARHYLYEAANCLLLRLWKQETHYDEAGPEMA